TFRHPVTSTSAPGRNSTPSGPLKGLPTMNVAGNLCHRAVEEVAEIRRHHFVVEGDLPLDALCPSSQPGHRDAGDGHVGPEANADAAPHERVASAWGQDARIRGRIAQQRMLAVRERVGRRLAFHIRRLDGLGYEHLVDAENLGEYLLVDEGRRGRGTRP